jgi:hypothetical protein
MYQLLAPPYKILDHPLFLLYRVDKVRFRGAEGKWTQDGYPW